MGGCERRGDGEGDHRLWMCTEEEGEGPATETEERLPGSKQGAESGRGVRTLGQIGLWSCVCNQNLRGQDFDPLLNFQIGV